MKDFSNDFGLYRSFRKILVVTDFSKYFGCDGLFERFWFLMDFSENFGCVGLSDSHIAHVFQVSIFKGSEYFLPGIYLCFIFFRSNVLSKKFLL